MVFIFEGLLYSDTVFQPIEEYKPADTSIPFLDYILDFFGWIWLGINILVNLMTFNVGHGIPLFIRLIILIPYWGIVLYILLPYLIEFTKAIGNLIPFT